MLNANIKKLIIHNTLWNTQFHLVVFTLFLLSKGLTMEQFFLAHAVGGVANLLAEVPTGVLADRVSRKASLIIGTLIHIVLTYIMIVTDSFPVLVVTFALGGISAAFLSGADQALLYDTLKALKREADFKKITGQMKWYAAWAGAGAGIVGGLLAQIDLSYPWWAWFFVAFPYLFIQLTLVEPPISREGTKVNDSYAFHLRNSFQRSLTGSASYFIAYAAVTSLFFGIGFWLWQPYLNLVGFSIGLFGILYAVINLVSGLAAKYAHKIESKVGMRISLLAVPMIFAIGLFLQSQAVIFWGFLFLFFQAVAGGYLEPILEDYIHTRIPSSQRATIFSIKSMASSLLFIIASPLIGRFIDLWSLSAALMMMAVLLFLAGLVFALFFRKSKSVESVVSNA